MAPLFLGHFVFQSIRKKTLHILNETHSDNIRFAYSKLHETNPLLSRPMNPMIPQSQGTSIPSCRATSLQDCVLAATAALNDLSPRTIRLTVFSILSSQKEIAQTSSGPKFMHESYTSS